MKKISFKNHQGIVLRGFVHEPKRYEKAIIFCHGFPGSSVGKNSLRVAKTFEKLGYLVLRFSFSGTPPSDGKFENKLMSTESREIKYAVDFLTKNYSFKQLILYGHSTGAVDVSLYAYKDKRITKVILAGAVGNLKQAVHQDFNDEEVHSFWTRGYMVYKKLDKWVHGKRLKKSFYDEYFKLDVLGSIHRLKKPLLIIHGGADDVVPVKKDPVEVFKAANKPKQFIIIKEADHSFTRPEHWKQVVSHIQRFIKNS